MVQVEPHSPHGIVVSPEERGNPIGRGRVVPEFYREVVRSEDEGVSAGPKAVGRSVESDARVSKFFLGGRNRRRIYVFEIRLPFGVDDAPVGERHEEDGSRHACRRGSRDAEISGIQRRSLNDSEVGNESREIFGRGMSGGSDADPRTSRVENSGNRSGIDFRSVGVDLQRRSRAYEREMVPLVQGEVRADFRRNRRVVDVEVIVVSRAEQDAVAVIAEREYRRKGRAGRRGEIEPAVDGKVAVEFEIRACGSVHVVARSVEIGAASGVRIR